MRKLAEQLDENGVMEENYGPWRALVVLAAKLYQENVTWHEYQWRICVSYQKKNQITCTFTLPTPCCDDAVQEIDTEEKYFISVEICSGYWQVFVEEEAQEWLELFTPCRKSASEIDAYGVLKWNYNIFSNDYEATSGMGRITKGEWAENVAPKTIVDDVLLYGIT